MFVKLEGKGKDDQDDIMIFIFSLGHWVHDFANGPYWKTKSDFEIEAVMKLPALIL